MDNWADDELDSLVLQSSNGGVHGARDLGCSAVAAGHTNGAASGGHSFARLFQRLREDIRLDMVRGIVVRLYYSRLTAYLYLATLVLAGVLLAITLGLDIPLRDSPRLLTGLEAIISLSLCAEVALRATVLGKDYIRSWPNVLDAVVALASASLLFWAAPRASQEGHLEKQKEDVELSQSLVMARTLVQFGRILVIAQHTQRSRQANAGDDVTFSALYAESGFDIDFDFALLRERRLRSEKQLSDDYDGL